MILPPGRTAIYRLYDAEGVLLYIGQTFRPPTMRMGEHEKAQPWWNDVASGTMVWVPAKDADAEERRAILAENPLHNHERHPVKTWGRPVRRTWALVPDGLGANLKQAGRRYHRSRTQANRMALAALIYEAYMLKCQPAMVRSFSGMMQEDARRMVDKYLELNPDLPPVPRRDIKRRQLEVA